MATEQRMDKLQRMVNARQKGLVVVLEDLRDPYNIGAITRTCDAFGVQNIHLIFEEQAIYNPKEVGKVSSSSANKWVDYTIHRSIDTGLQTVKAEDYIFVATVADEDAPTIFEVDLRAKKLALLVGNERRGLSKQALEMADIKVTIPMRGIVQSLNVSVATAIMLYEITRQRQLYPEHYESSQAEREALLKDFLFR